eukprot:Colp12_sorted_trinity150504_noHs@23255
MQLKAQDRSNLLVSTQKSDYKNLKMSKRSKKLQDYLYDDEASEEEEAVDSSDDEPEALKKEWNKILKFAAKAEAAEAEASTSDKKEVEYYDEEYFDSDDEDDGENKMETDVAHEKKRVVKPSNDELLYDDRLDDENAAWVERNIYNRGNKEEKLKTVKEKKGDDDEEPEEGSGPGPLETDAILSCPACFTLLCVNCQGHELYMNQFRAMFVLNCKVNKSQVLREDTRQGSRHAQTGQSQEIFHPVACEHCGTEVGVMDGNQIYHFFNILASPP